MNAGWLEAVWTYSLACSYISKSAHAPIFPKQIGFISLAVCAFSNRTHWRKQTECSLNREKEQQRKVAKTRKFHSPLSLPFIADFYYVFMRKLRMLMRPLTNIKRSYCTATKHSLFFSGNFQFHSKKFLNFLLQVNNNAQHSGWKKGKQG